MVSLVEESVEDFGVGPFQINLLGFGFREVVIIERSAKVFRVFAYVTFVYEYSLFSPSPQRMLIVTIGPTSLRFQFS